jgi:thiamine-monophosphate kinase
VIGFTVLGECAGQPLLRSGAQPADVIWHSGQLGLSQVGLSLLAAGQPPTGEQEVAAVAAHRRPRARLQLGEWLQRVGLVHACLDLSDSLAQCLLQLAEASGAGLSVDFRDYPFAAAVPGFIEQQAHRTEDSSGAFVLPGRCDPGGAERRYRSLAEFVLGSAEDYELLLTAPARATRQLLDTCPLPLTRLGTVTEAGQGRSYIDEGGQQQELMPVGYAHLPGDAD